MAVQQPLVLCVEYIDDESGTVTNQEQANVHNTPWFYFIYDLLSSERKYERRLQRLSKASKLLDECQSLKKLAVLIDKHIMPVVCVSAALISKLEYLLTHWQIRNRSVETPRGDINDNDFSIIFTRNLWATYDQYHQALAHSICPLLRRCRRQRWHGANNNNSSPGGTHAQNKVTILLGRVLDECGQSLEQLLLLPEHRVIDYEQRLREFRSGAETLCKALDDTLGELDQKSSTDTRNQLLSSIENELSVENVEAKFDGKAGLIEGELEVDAETGEGQRVGDDMIMARWGRRKARSGSLKDRSVTVSDLPSGTDNTEKSASKNLARQRSLIDLSEQMALSEDNYLHMQMHNNANAESCGQIDHLQSVRTYLKEAKVQLANGVHTYERYLFLFSDLLLIAKEKGVNSYKLKDKVRVCEMWTRSVGVDEIAQFSLPTDRCFVIGWPTVNYVAVFASASERDDWLKTLEQGILIEQQREPVVATKIPVTYKPGKNVSETGFTRRQLEDFASMSTVASKCRFVLRPRSRSAAPSAINRVPLERECRSGTGSKGGKLRRAAERPGNIVSQIKKRVMLKAETVAAIGLNTPSQPTGLLFGHPLHTLTDDNSFPKPIYDILAHLASEGVDMEGIFRKPPKQSAVRHMKERMDNGEQVDLGPDVSPLVSASLLKDFLRNLPNKLLVNDMYYEWTALCAESDPQKKMYLCRRLLSQLPPANYQLLRHLLCVLRRICDMRHVNHMSASNLSVCVGQSLLEKCTGQDINDSVKMIPQLTEYLIENVGDLFGADTLSLFPSGDAPPVLLLSPPQLQQPPRGTNEDRCSSSADSLAAATSNSGASVTADSRPQSASLPPCPTSHSSGSGGSSATPNSCRRGAAPPHNESHDSGLSEVHLLIEPPMHASTPDRGVLSVNRDCKQLGEGEQMFGSNRGRGRVDVRPCCSNDFESPNVDDKTGSGSGGVKRRSAFGRADVTAANIMSRSWHQTVNMEADSCSGGAQPPDTLLKCDMTSSLALAPGQQLSDVAPSQNGGKSNRRHNTASIVRSESGEHLLLSVDVNESSGGRRHATCHTPPITARHSQTDLPLSLPSNALLSPSTSSCTSSGTSPRPSERASDGASGSVGQPAHSPDSALPEDSESPLQHKPLCRGSAYRRGNRLRRSPPQGSPSPPRDASPERSDAAAAAAENGRAARAVAQSARLCDVTVSSSGNSSLSSLAGDQNDGASNLYANRWPGNSALRPAYHRSKSQDTRHMTKARTSANVNSSCQNCDSSTVTETSENDDDPTPVVSRENSAAHEFKAKATRMFRQNTVGGEIGVKHDRRQSPQSQSQQSQVIWHGRKMSAELVSDVDLEPLATQGYRPPITARPLYSWESRDSSYFTDRPVPANQRPVAQVAAMVVRAPSSDPQDRRQGARNDNNGARLPPSYESSVQLRREIRRGASATERDRFACLSSVSQFPQSQSQQMAKLSTAVTQVKMGRRVPRSSPRRKTLGSTVDDYKFIEAGAIKSQQPRPSYESAMDSPNSNQPLSDRPAEINWSVHKLRSLFDAGHNLAPGQVGGERGRSCAGATQASQLTEPMQRRYASAAGTLFRQQEPHTRRHTQNQPSSTHLAPHHEKPSRNHLGAPGGGPPQRRSPTKPAAGTVKSLASSFEPSSPQRNDLGRRHARKGEVSYV